MRTVWLHASMSLREKLARCGKAVFLKPIALAIVLAGSLLATFPATATDPVVYCGVVAVNSIKSGQGSGSRTLELQVTSGPGGGGRFHVSASISFPTVGSYICGQFVQGVPINELAALLSPGDTGYVAQPEAATGTPVPSAVPSAVSIAIAEPQTGTAGLVWVLLLGLAGLAAAGLISRRSRRSMA